jgi:cytochrome b561
MKGLPFSPEKLEFYGWHKSFGVLVIGLFLLRIVWRFYKKPPVLPGHMSAIERLAANTGHAVLYLLLIIMPLSGWLMSSAAGFPVSFFGLFQLPDLIAADAGLKKLLNSTHTYIGWFFTATITMHVMATIYHYFYHKDNVLKRMLP